MHSLSNSGTHTHTHERAHTHTYILHSNKVNKPTAVRQTNWDKGRHAVWRSWEKQVPNSYRIITCAQPYFQLVWCDDLDRLSGDGSLNAMPSYSWQLQTTEVNAKWKWDTVVLSWDTAVHPYSTNSMRCGQLRLQMNTFFILTHVLWPFRSTPLLVVSHPSGLLGHRLPLIAV
jgi:hypothetical protein